MITLTRRCIATIAGRYTIGLRNQAMCIKTGRGSANSANQAHTIAQHEYLFRWLRNKISTDNPTIHGWWTGPWSANPGAAAMFVLFQGWSQ